MNQFYTNPRLSVILVLFILVLGTTAALTLARQEDPTMVERWANVVTPVPGATANRVESLVSEPIETKLREITEIKTISSVSRAGLSVAAIEMYDYVDKDKAELLWSEVRDKLGEIHTELPIGTPPPELRISSPIASTIIVAFRWTADTKPEHGIISRLAESLRLKLANLSGTKEANTYGAVEEEVLISVNPSALSAAGISIAAVSAAIAGADTKHAAGRLRNASSDMLVEVDAELKSVERIGQVPLKTLINSSGAQVLRVSDVATVRKHTIDPPAGISQWGQQQAVFVNAKMEPGIIIDNWIAGARDVVADFKQTVPVGIELDIVYDQNHYTGDRMQSLLTNLMLALAIVMTVLVFFMGVRAALVVGIALPLSGAMVLAGMSFLDVPLHQMSVTGLIIALGLLIDNAIVVVEDYKLRRRKGLEIPDAINSAVRHLRIPLGASTLTTVFAFMPIVMAPGGVGDFTGTIGLSVSLAVLSSFILAMTVVPAIAGFVDRRFPPKASTRHDGKQSWVQNGMSSERLTNLYRRSLRTVIAKPWLGILVGLVLPIIGFGLAPTLTQQFFPPVDRNQFQVQIAMPRHTSIRETQVAVNQADAVLRSIDGITDTFWAMGEAPPRTYYNVMLLNDGIASFAGGWVNTTSPETTHKILPMIQQRLSEALPQAEVLALPFEQGPPVNAPIEMRVVGPDFAVLRDIAEQLRLILSEIDEVTYSRATLSVAEPKMVFSPNENMAAAAGIRTGDLPNLLANSLVGMPAGSVQEGSTKLNIRVRLSDANRNDVSDLVSMPFATSMGAGVSGTVPLDQLGTWQLVPAPAAIDRYQGDRISSVQAFLTPFALPAATMAKFEAAIVEANIEIPPGYRLDIGGEAEQRTQSVGNLLSIFSFFAVAMGAVVILSLNSFRQAALIGLVGFLSIGLSLFGLRVFGWPLGYVAFIGTLGMVGLAINGAIIVLSALKAETRSQTGELEGTIDVVVDATRHIISTTATTIGGFIPLIIFGGTFWPPLATAIAGGVGGSAILALYTVPAVYRSIAARNQQPKPPLLRDKTEPYSSSTARAA